MINKRISAYLDFELTQKLESFVINALPQQSYMSDFNLIYIANIEMSEENGIRTQEKVISGDSFFLAITNEYGHIDFDIVKTVHVAGVIESDFETIEYYPSLELMPKFANFYEGKEVPAGGGFLQIAICPFGVNKVELLNGDIVHVYGNGKIKITAEQRGFKGYKQIPKINEILGNNYFKILKLAIYSRYRKYSYRKYSINLFSPSMQFIQEPIEGQLELTNEKIKFYSNAEMITDSQSGLNFIINKKDDSLSPVEATKGFDSILYGIKDMIKVERHGFIDLSTYGQSIGSEFSIHMNVVISKYASKGTILFDMGYGLTSVGYQTHKITLWLDKDGILCYNNQYSDEWVSTGFTLKKGFEHTITYTVENQRYDVEDDDEFTTFIHVNGKQIWPENKMITKTEKIYLWRAMEAYRTYNEVCMLLPAPDPINGGLDAKDVCAKKLLQESGFITLENMAGVYELYLQRPRAHDADLKDVIIGNEENTTIKKIFFGQDSEKDVFDGEYYFDGQFSEILIFSPGLGREEIESLHLLNTMRSESVRL